MSGKPYTMKEMKEIVDYLTEHRVYSEIRGRKMWMDFASSKLTNRTWQSLKETFLKRILPDIHNPYYNLSLHQISSFRQGYDIEAKLKNKLEVRPVHEEKSNINGDSKKDMEHPDKSNDKNEENVSGEDSKHSKVVTDHRASVDTVILENCNEATEESKADIALPTNNEEQEDEVISTGKSLRDMIEYEPMTPMLQKIIDDFDDGDSSDKEPRMEIDEDAIQKNGNDDNSPIVVSDSEDILDKNIDNNDNKDTVVNDIIKNEESRNNDIQGSENKIPVNEAVNINEATNKNRESNSSETMAQSNTTNDTPLPNNQEVLNTDSKLKQSGNSPKLSLKKKGNKRDHSTESETGNSKKKKENKNPVLDTVNSDQSGNAKNNSPVIHIKSDTTNKIEENLKETRKNVDSENNESLENPCLKSVSLYEEQFTFSKFSSDEEINNKASKIPKKQNQIEKKNENLTNVLLKSYSDSSSETETELKIKKKSHGPAFKSQRNKTLASMLGFSSGAVSEPHRRRASLKKQVSKSGSKIIGISSDSSDNSSYSGSEYISPPRGRKNRGSRKYLKPKPARILSLEEEGGLFVVHGKKIYPVIKDGGIVKNFTAFSPNESEEENSHWKLKYLEEKKKNMELLKLLKRKESQEAKSASEVPPQPSISEVSNTKSKESKEIQDKQPRTGTEGNQGDEVKTVKIKMIQTSDNKEVQVEGHWSQIHPVLAQVAQLLQTEPQPKRSSKKNSTDTEISRNKSGMSTPVIMTDEVSEKVNRLEGEIFKEIEERDKIENEPTIAKKSDENVTIRNTRTRKSQPAATVHSPSKKTKLNVETATENVKEEETKKPSASGRGRRRTRTPRKHENVEKPEITPTRTRRSLSKPPTVDTNIPEKAIDKVEENIDEVDDEDVRYKFPSPVQTSSKTATKQNKNKRTESLNRYIRRSSSPEKLESSHMQTFQNSMNMPEGRSKKILSLIPANDKTHNPSISTSSKSTLELTDDLSETSNSYQGDILQSVTFENSSLNSEIYRSESYQLLMPKIRSASQHLEKIIENSPCGKFEEKVDAKNEGEDYSMTSLPTSPVLSIVENISISKSMLNSFDDFPDTDKMDTNFTPNLVTLNEFLTPEVNQPGPLMEQLCGIEECRREGQEYHYNLNIHNVLTPTTESLVNKLDKVNIDNQTISDSLNAKLGDMILDSNKKPEKKAQTGDKVTESLDKNNNSKPTKTRKRSSTPRRNPTTRKKRFTSAETAIEEEHMETCALGRKSCPPVIQIFDVSQDTTNNNSTEVQNKNQEKSKTRKKKDIIKVKIPQRKNTSIDRKQNVKKTFSSSDINLVEIHNSPKSSMLLQELNDSVDLIHNHSETCLHTNECVGDSSVEVLGGSHESVISIASNSDDEGNQNLITVIADKHTQELLYDNNAQDETQFSRARNFTGTELPIQTDTVFHTAMSSLSSANSLMTEDLTVDIPSRTVSSSKWYLLSEEENSNTNCFDINHNTQKGDYYGSNLNQIFPITLAVPDLSTITEGSKDADESTRKTNDSCGKSIINVSK